MALPVTARNGRFRFPKMKPAPEEEQQPSERVTRTHAYCAGDPEFCQESFRQTETEANRGDATTRTELRFKIN